ncbi:GntR family transcriptional regulator [Paenibacillus psychroresistens]|uniref:GntR family transcriptional regulator n=1 Tax=Paenibacillus psychroresistens TaxID=1778678 RepID=A0A6B8RKD7_9BACL|nr:substrate-binding domain-containing protein [Paenibacillus psychroresistens]QGQ96055.1 GntR family transcriptional regulator [Paenibacillus psychroresistens]
MEGTPLVKQRITELLRNQIKPLQTNTYVKIASERELTELLNVSRISIRSAIKQLVQEGLLSQEQGRGTFITPKMVVHSLHILCSPDIKSNDPFYTKFLVEITHTAAKLSISLHMINPDQLNPPLEQAPLILIGLLEQKIFDRLATMYTTIITFQEEFTSNEATLLYFDDYLIGQHAAKMLVEFKHEHLILLTGPSKYPSAFNRKKGFVDALKDTQIKLQVHTDKMNWSGGYQAGDAIMEWLQADSPPTAIFAANDWMAIGLIQKLRERGISIPKNLSVIGCDDIPLAAEFSPTLTTFNLDMKLLISELLSVLNQGTQGNKKILLPATFVPRESLIPFRKKRGV